MRRRIQRTANTMGQTALKEMTVPLVISQTQDVSSSRANSVSQEAYQGPLPLCYVWQWHVQGLRYWQKAVPEQVWTK